MVTLHKNDTMLLPPAFVFVPRFLVFFFGPFLFLCGPFMLLVRVVHSRGARHRVRREVENAAGA